MGPCLELGHAIPLALSLMRLTSSPYCGRFGVGLPVPLRAAGVDPLPFGFGWDLLVVLLVAMGPPWIGYSTKCHVAAHERQRLTDKSIK
jgi:hypothetical protein